ncbi:OmpA family protein [Vibrio fluvialis]|uniref:OmpA family protein n=1 Tax=Vibrio fluvialis TaxID=676 RepID=UPI0030C7D932
MKMYASYDNSVAYLNDRKVSIEGKKYFYHQVLKICSITSCALGLFLTMPSFAEQEIKVPMDLSSWIYKGDVFNCNLMHTEVPHGKFYFRSVTNNKISFEFRFNNSPVTWQQADLSLLTPPWIVPQQATPISEGIRHQGNRFSFSTNIDALLHAIDQGQWLQLSLSGSTPSESQRVTLPSIRVHNVITQFKACQQQLPAITFTEARDTSLHFASGQQSLSAAQQRTLRDLISYVERDKRVMHLLIDGHTDNVGSRLANLSVSRSRADQVAAVLEKLGVAADKIQIRAHGSRYPVASNETESGRAQNRRVVIRLVRDDESVVAATPPTNDSMKVQ